MRLRHLYRQFELRLALLASLALVDLCLHLLALELEVFVQLRALEMQLAQELEVWPLLALLSPQQVLFCGVTGGALNVGALYGAGMFIPVAKDGDAGAPGCLIPPVDGS